MENRAYFVLGDFFSNLMAGLLVGIVSALCVDTGWNMLVAMFLMMALGMVIAMLLWIPVSIFFGAMEVMVPLMFTGMLSGMLVGTLAAMQPITVSDGFLLGAATGLACVGLIWAVNLLLSGKREV